MTERTYLLRLELDYAEPKIWREIAVPASISLDRLHDVIQIAMDWEDKHLHMFNVRDEFYAEGIEDSPRSMPESEFRLDDLIKRKGQSLSYFYDFGDSWSHTVTVADSRWQLPGHSLPILCVGGERSRPPEDVGGVPGYEDFLASLANPSHEEHRTNLDWVGGAFDPEHFDIMAVNSELAKYWRWSRDRGLPWVEGY